MEWKRTREPVSHVVVVIIVSASSHFNYVDIYVLDLSMKYTFFPLSFHQNI